MNRKKFVPILFFAIAMACIEAATVVYLRDVFGINDLMRDIPLYNPKIAPIELCRELATLVMLLTLGWAAGKSLQSRLSFALFAFGVWDIAYYIWLRVFVDWPTSLLDMDLLFLIPLPWWGPIITPMLIACLMIIWGMIAVIKEEKGRKIKMSWLEWGGAFLGVLIMLYSFMRDAIVIIPASYEQISAMRPTSFNWYIYFCGLLLTGYCILRNLLAVDKPKS